MSYQAISSSSLHARSLDEAMQASTSSRPRRRLSNHSNISSHSHRSASYRDATAPLLRPSDRQLSGGAGSLPVNNTDNNLNSAYPRPRSKKRTSSEASRTSTVLSANRYQRTSRDRVTSLNNTQPVHSDNTKAVSSPVETRKRSVGTPILPHDSPIRRWVRLVEKAATANVGSIAPPSRARYIESTIAIGTLVWIKWAVGLGGWSGRGHPPLFGDMEAQRNWLSLTLHMPVNQWYWHNLSYWGLDYPPLTAYHSLLLAKIAKKFGNPAWVELVGNASGRIVRNEESSALYMRYTVIIGDLLLWALPVAAYCAVELGRWKSHTSSKRSTRTLFIAFYSIMLQPGLIMIDSGHFQYNSIMLGLTLMSVLAMQLGYDSLGAVCFVCSMCFKQMAIYYAPAVFAYLLGKCIWLGGAEGLNLFTSLAFFSTAALLTIFSPFLWPISQLQQALHRIFPFARGLFEDKVANVWCSVNVVVKLRNLLSVTALARISAVLTLTAVLPIIAGVVWTSWQLRQRIDDAHHTPSLSQSHRRPAPTAKLLPHALFCSAMAFFLFSFQVHEKSILLPLMPITLLLAGRQPGLPGQDYEWAVLLNNIGCFSMYPLLKRDGLALPTIALTLFWNFGLGHNPFRAGASALKILSLLVYSTAVLILLADTVITPPIHLPDIFLVLNVLLSCGVFGLGWLWSLKRLVEEIWGLIGLGREITISSAQSQGPSFSVSPNTASPRQDFFGKDALNGHMDQPLTRQSLSQHLGDDSASRRYKVPSITSNSSRRVSRKSPLVSPIEIFEGDTATRQPYGFEDGMSTIVSPSKTLRPEGPVLHPYENDYR